MRECTSLLQVTKTRSAAFIPPRVLAEWSDRSDLCPVSRFVRLKNGTLPEVASFMQRSIAALRSPDAPHSAGVEDTTSDSNFDWILGRGNTAFDDRIPACEIVRDTSWHVVGMLCYSPRYFRLGEGRFLGLGAHNFYVDSGARMQGFILFKRYMNNRAADFCYSTTCNANSGPLWKKMCASELPNSDAEFLLPLRSGPLLEEAAHRMGLPAFVRKACHPLGSLADLVLHPRKSRGHLKVERALTGNASRQSPKRTAIGPDSVPNGM